MNTLTEWKVIEYQKFSKIFFDLFKNASLSKERESEIYFRATCPTWKRRGDAATVVFPKYKEEQVEEVFCLIKRLNNTKLQSSWVSFYEPNLELAMFKADVLAADQGYVINDPFSITVLQREETCVAF